MVGVITAAFASPIVVSMQRVNEIGGCVPEATIMV
jgi:hypothetical protein